MLKYCFVSAGDTISICGLYVSDEYNFLHYYLEIWKVTGQALIMSGKNKVACDVLHLGEKSNYWDKPDIYFDVTRVLLLEEGTFK